MSFGSKFLHFHAVFGENNSLASPVQGLVSLGNPGSATGSYCSIVNIFNLRSTLHQVFRVNCTVGRNQLLLPTKYERW